jgi:hypothetical protein
MLISTYTRTAHRCQSQCRCWRGAGAGVPVVVPARYRCIGMCVSVLIYRTDTADVPTLHRSGSNHWLEPTGPLDTLPSDLDSTF